MCSVLSCNSQKNVSNNVKVADSVSSVSITEKEWVAIELFGEKLEELNAKRLPWMTLSEGKITGNTSCNNMHGTYTMENEKITFGMIAATKMFCFDTKDIEANYLKAIAEVKTWKYEDGKLYFLDEKTQTIIVFVEMVTND